MVAERVPAPSHNPNGRPSNAVLQGRLEHALETNLILSAEIFALRGELRRTGHELTGLGSRIDLSIRADRPDVAQHIAGRLFTLGRALVRRGEARA